MKRYKIGDFARQMGVTLDFIKYYTEKGLIASTQDPANHYRYFDFRQSEIVERIQYYRGLGFSTPEIEQLLHRATAEDLDALYTLRLQQLQAEIDACQYAVEQLEQFQHAVHNCVPGTWYIVPHPSFYFLPHTNDEEYIRDPATLQAVRSWSDRVPYVCGLDRWQFDSSTHELLHVQHGRAIDAQTAERIGLPVGMPAQLIPKSRCIEYYLEHTFERSFNESPSLTADKLQDVLQVLEEKHFVIKGEVYLRILSFYIRNGQQREQSVLYIPIL